MSKSVRINGYKDGKIDCFKVDTLRGCSYGLSSGDASWVLPLDSVKYHQHATDITKLIDSILLSRIYLTLFMRNSTKNYRSSY